MHKRSRRYTLSQKLFDLARGARIGATGAQAALPIHPLLRHLRHGAGGGRGGSEQVQGCNSRILCLRGFHFALG